MGIVRLARTSGSANSGAQGILMNVPMPDWLALVPRLKKVANDANVPTGSLSAPVPSFARSRLRRTSRPWARIANPRASR